MKKLILALLLILSLSLFSCSEKKYSKQLWGMFDTVVEVSGYFDSEEDFERAVEITQETLSYYNELFSIYEDSENINLKSINESGGEIVEIDRELFDFLAFFKEIEINTNGACKMAFGSVTSLWKKTISSDVPLPTDSELFKANSHTLCDTIELLENPCRIRLTDPDVRIDPGAVAKGWAGKKLEKKLIDSGFDSLLVNMGGHVIAVGDKCGNTWSVGIRNPEGGIFTTVNVTGKSVVTSGVYERGREIDGTLYHHIISPKTLYPASHFASVTVISDDSALADALSTALFISPLDEGLKILKNYPDISALWIYPDGTHYKTNNFPD